MEVLSLLPKVVIIIGNGIVNIYLFNKWFLISNVSPIRVSCIWLVTVIFVGFVKN